MFWFDCWLGICGLTGGLFWLLICNGGEFYLVVAWFGLGGGITGGEGGGTTFDCYILDCVW